MTTSSAEITRKMLPQLNGCTWLPTAWAADKKDLFTVADSTTLSRPLYAIWLQNSDKQQWIKELLKAPIII